MKSRNILVILILLLVAFGLSSTEMLRSFGSIMRDISEKKEDEKFYAEIRSLAKDDAGLYSKTSLLMYMDFSGMAGWICIEGTEISYPVMLEEGSVGYYLDHRADGAYSSAGSLFIPSGNGPSDDNVIIYGHHMRNGTMFAGLEAYKDEEWANAHRSITFISEEGAATYEVISVFVQSMAEEGYRWENKVMFEDDMERDDFRHRIEGLSRFRFGDTNREYTRFITLVTCDYSVPEGRVIVVGAL